MFMGDSGSMLIGLVLAGSALSLSGSFPPGAFSSAPLGQGYLLLVLLPVLLPVSVLIVPFVDLLLAVVRRMRRGQSPFAPDKQHLHHRLLQYGHSHRRAVLVIWLWAALVAIGGVALALFPGRLVVGGLALWLLVTVVLTLVVPRVERPGWTHGDDYAPVPPR
jgi:UDP-GlcNAc:undecaprenyl-phosphate GlcNAc-1-phosphate transferase